MHRLSCRLEQLRLAVTPACRWPPVCAASPPRGKRNTAAAQTAALRNSSLQGAYLIIAARMLGLDCGPMSGFNAPMLDAAFFPDGRYKSNFLINLGYGDAQSLRPRGPRLSFDAVATVL